MDRGSVGRPRRSITVACSPAVERPRLRQLDPPRKDQDNPMPIDALFLPSLQMPESGCFRRSQDWCGQGFAQFHTYMQSSPQSGKLQPLFFRPGRQCLRFAFILYQAIVRAISHLGFFRCPSNVARRIVSIVINPINAETLRAWSHVSKKVLKRCELRIYSYALSTIVLPVLYFGISASCPHVLPCSVLGSVSLCYPISFHGYREDSINLWA